MLEGHPTDHVLSQTTAQLQPQNYFFPSLLSIFLRYLLLDASFLHLATWFSSLSSQDSTCSVYYRSINTAQ